MHCSVYSRAMTCWTHDVCLFVVKTWSLDSSHRFLSKLHPRLQRRTASACKRLLMTLVSFDIFIESPWTLRGSGLQSKFCFNLAFFKYSIYAVPNSTSKSTTFFVKLVLTNFAITSFTNCFLFVVLESLRMYVKILFSKLKWNQFSLPWKAINSRIHVLSWWL